MREVVREGVREEVTEEVSEWVERNPMNYKHPLPPRTDVVSCHFPTHPYTHHRHLQYEWECNSHYHAIIINFMPP